MYRVWTKDDFSDNYTCVEVEKEEEVKSAIMGGVKEGKSLLLTRDVSFALNILLNAKKEPEHVQTLPIELGTAKLAKKEEKVEVKPSEVKSTENPGD